ncbi:N-acetyltransferase Ats1 [Schizosaccharomyces japonicus yFS275]|uniref:N-acetyltransferase Ats1 n=1 Tax=Schizosaccharomyces japonicus (strain yFS275 / FY16936) TaxID=402676 RepID=B6K3U7_SCHJY|nr:N-acetyltransferase Ats1 [Schizosaccharomyces japonicus yFS275]EEB08154.1 N-acetyltransferase Ats1 [Schizosaccharomyces japonicus yFS275]
MTNKTTAVVRRLKREDCPVVLQFIKELAEYQKEPQQVEATVEKLEKAFGFVEGTPAVPRGVLVEENGEPVGMAIYFPNFSTWTGCLGVYLEDLYVRPSVRGKGYGKLLLSFLARETVLLGGKRLDWSVLNWNKNAIEVYKRVGAKALHDWIHMRLSDDELESMAKAFPEGVLID